MSGANPAPAKALAYEDVYARTKDTASGSGRDQHRNPPVDVEAPADGALPTVHAKAVDRNGQGIWEDPNGFNIQWLLFILGVFFVIPSIVASFLPLAQRPRFPTRSYKAGWIANVVTASVLTILYIALGAAMGAAASRYLSYSYWYY